jgi:hypothetical protein
VTEGGGERWRTEGERRERGRKVYRWALDLPIANGLAITNRFLSFSYAALFMCMCVCVCVCVCECVSVWSFFLIFFKKDLGEDHGLEIL